MVNGVLWFYVSPLPMSSLSFPLPRFLIVCILLIVIAQIGFGMLFFLSTFFSLLLFNGLASLLNSLASLLFPPMCLPSASTVLCRCRFCCYFRQVFGFCRRGLIALVKRSRQVVGASAWTDSLGRVFRSPAPLFLALALLKRGVVSPERLNLGLDVWSSVSIFSLLGYMATL